MIATTSVNGYAGCASAIQKLNYLDSLDQITGLPVLFIAGAQDAGTPPAGMEAMHANMPGSEYVLLDPAAHFPTSKGRWISRRPCRVWQNFRSRRGPYRRRVRGWIE